MHEERKINYLTIRNEMMIDQLISFYKSNKKVRSENMMDHLISQTKHLINV
jgi:hypothetical protein